MWSVFKSERVVVFLAAVALFGGIAWFVINEIQKNTSPVGLDNAIARCDSSARSLLKYPDTMAPIGNIQYVANEMGGFVIQREIAARDKSGIEYRYRYYCAAMPDGRGGIGEATATLIPTNR